MMIRKQFRFQLHLHLLDEKNKTLSPSLSLPQISNQYVPLFYIMYTSTKFVFDFFFSFEQVTNIFYRTDDAGVRVRVLTIQQLTLNIVNFFVFTLTKNKARTTCETRIENVGNKITDIYSTLKLLN